MSTDLAPSPPPSPPLSLPLALAVRAWGATWRLRPERSDPPVPPGPAVLVGWHGEQLALLRAWRHLPLQVLVSRSRDGDLAAGTLARLGVGSLRGSTSRGGAAALRAGARVLAAGGLVAILADGPRGPRHQAAPGAAALSALAGCPVVCLRALPATAARLRSWDRFEIPAPFTRITLRTRVLPPVARGRDGVEAGRRAVEAALSALGPGSGGGGPYR